MNGDEDKTKRCAVGEEAHTTQIKRTQRRRCKRKPRCRRRRKQEADGEAEAEAEADGAGKAGRKRVGGWMKWIWMRGQQAAGRGWVALSQSQ